MRISLDWLGCATFRLTIGELVLFLDAYLDRVAAAPPVGLTVAEVRSADFVLVGHSHFDHAWGAERIALSTGARVVGSHETIRLMRKAAVPEGQCLAVSGGERVALATAVTVRVLPSQHSCIWARASWNAGEACVGDAGLTLQEREARFAAGGGWLQRDDRPGMDAVRAHFAACPHQPRGDGGALAYLFETPVGSILWKDTSGHWAAVLRDLRPDVAILAAAGRANIDGEPVQGSLAEFIAQEVELLHPRQVLLGHHDDWMPPTTGAIDPAPIRHELARRAPDVALVETGYLAGYDPMAAIR
jgi:L-ascorbate metabolism protein UlaG (beta-lactamase superfamily)